MLLVNNLGMKSDSFVVAKIALRIIVATDALKMFAFETFDSTCLSQNFSRLLQLLTSVISFPMAGNFDR
jgi:hypothetical protein